MGAGTRLCCCPIVHVKTTATPNRQSPRYSSRAATVNRCNSKTAHERRHRRNETRKQHERVTRVAQNNNTHTTTTTAEKEKKKITRRQASGERTNSTRRRDLRSSRRPLGLTPIRPAHNQEPDFRGGGGGGGAASRGGVSSVHSARGQSTAVGVPCQITRCRASSSSLTKRCKRHAERPTDRWRGGRAAARRRRRLQRARELGRRPMRMRLDGAVQNESSARNRPTKTTTLEQRR